MALTKIQASTDVPAPARSKLDTFATALGILNNLGGLGAQAANSFSATPAATKDMMATGGGSNVGSYNFGGVDPKLLQFSKQASRFQVPQQNLVGVKL